MRGGPPNEKRKEVKMITSLLKGCAYCKTSKWALMVNTEADEDAGEPQVECSECMASGYLRAPQDASTYWDVEWRHSMPQ